MRRANEASRFATNPLAQAVVCLHILHVSCHPCSPPHVRSARSWNRLLPWHRISMPFCKHRWFFDIQASMETTSHLDGKSRHVLSRTPDRRMAGTAYGHMARIGFSRSYFGRYAGRAITAGRDETGFQYSFVDGDRAGQWALYKYNLWQILKALESE